MHWAGGGFARGVKGGAVARDQQIAHQRFTAKVKIFQKIFQKSLIFF
jgi:hypothetical protein